MPIYDYVCTNCRQLTEVIHGIDAPGPRFCPACGAEGTLRKAFAPPTVHFKGSGWAKKDRSAARATKSKPAGDGGEGGAASKDGLAAPDTAGPSAPADRGASTSSKPASSPDGSKGATGAASAKD